ncbi:MAG TPA: TlpA disulfide reductase family protein [Pyrinomonadaceae bacterium]|nr:TlpA disulfide reductase family protein [Pyrinomonadaceae bacterium]
MQKIFIVAMGLLLLFGSMSRLGMAQDTIKVEGQIVCCADCWAEADRTKVEFGTAADLIKAKSCVENGDPTLLAVREGDKFTLYQLELGRYKLPGKNWLEFIGKRVAVTGSLRKKADVEAFRVDTLTVTAPSIAERQASNAQGQVVELALKDLSGIEQRLSALKGRIVILNFWATYCIPCRMEMPDLAAIQTEYAALGVQVIGATADDADARAEILKFIKETKINFPVWVGATARDMMRFGLGGALPGTVIIDNQGRIAKAISGVINAKELKKELDQMIAATGAQTITTPKTKQSQETPAKSSPNDVSSVPS